MVQPDFIVDVSRTVGTKRAMLAEHASQRAWLRAQHGTDDYLDQMEQWTRERGRPAGMEYGEGFRQYRGHPYPLSAMLEGLLGTAVGGALTGSVSSVGWVLDAETRRKTRRAGLWREWFGGGKGHARWRGGGASLGGWCWTRRRGGAEEEAEVLRIG